MWLFVFFDLPVTAAVDRKQANSFRKHLLADGFVMMQYSVYVRHCPSRQKAIVHVNRIRKIAPRGGIVSILQVTDKQYSQIINIVIGNAKPPPQQLEQLTLF